MVDTRWITGSASILTYELDELLGTKLRALFQRKKGMDLFDLWWAGRYDDSIDYGRVVRCFHEYLAHEGIRVSHAEFEANLSQELNDPAFAGDTEPLLAPGIDWVPTEGARLLDEEVLPRLKGEPWKGHGHASDRT